MWQRGRPLLYALLVGGIVSLVLYASILFINAEFSGNQFLIRFHVAILIGGVSLAFLPSLVAGYLSKEHGWLYGAVVAAFLVAGGGVFAPWVPLPVYLIVFAIAAGAGELVQNVARRQNDP